MIQAVLRAKHWQMFMPLFVLPMLLNFTMLFFIMEEMIQNIQDNTVPDPFFMFDYMGTMMPLMVVGSAFIYVWYGSIAFGLKSKLPEGTKLGFKGFKWSLIFPLVYLPISMFLMMNFMNEMKDLIVMDPFDPDLMYNDENYQAAAISPEDLFGPSFYMMMLSVPLHMVAVFCSFYNIYFVAMVFKTAELQRKPKFDEYIKEFLLFWFHPIGVWILQPRLNGLAKDSKKSD